MLDMLRLCNIRSLRDTGEVPIRPITLLVGANSSGKSSFARLIPLLRQSMERATDGPLLWYGPYVDYGDLETTRSWGVEEPLRVELGLHMEGGPARALLSVSRRGTQDEISEYTLESGGYPPVRCELREGSLHLRLASEEHNAGPAPAYALPLGNARGTAAASLLPTPDASEDALWRPKKLSGLHKDLDELLIKGGAVPGESEAKTEGRSERKWYLDRLCRTETWSQALKDMLILLPLGLMVDSTPAGSRRPGKPHRATPEWIPEPEILERLKLLLALGSFWHRARSFNRALMAQLSRTAYLGPARVAPERYKRAQNVSVAQLDRDGANLPELLASLGAAELAELSTWCEGHLGFGIDVERSGPHVQVQVLGPRTGARKVSLADTGFGISQVLPVAVQLWMAARGGSGQELRDAQLIVMEQPELHLHPRLQAGLAQALAGAVAQAREGRRSLRLLVETHSEAMVNRLGELVAQGVIQPEDCAVVLFHRDDPAAPTRVEVTEYNRQGELKQWPYGFFDY